LNGNFNGQIIATWELIFLDPIGDGRDKPIQIVGLDFRAVPFIGLSGLAIVRRPHV